MKGKKKAYTSIFQKQLSPSKGEQRNNKIREKRIKESLNKDNVQKVLLDIYNGSYNDENGNKISKPVQSLLRAEIDVICSLADIKYEELLTVPDYSEELLGCVERVERLSLFAEVISNCSNKSDILKSIVSKEGDK